MSAHHVVATGTAMTAFKARDTLTEQTTCYRGLEDSLAHVRASIDAIKDHDAGR